MFKKSLINLKRIIKKILPAFFYSYPFFILYNLTQKLLGYYIEKKICSQSIGYYPNVKNPQSYNEKVLWKKLYDRNPILPIISDKYSVREYLKNYLGDTESEKILIPLIYVTNKPETIPFDSLPKEFILKANNACKRYIIAEDIKNQRRFIINNGDETTILFDSKITRRAIINICEKWLSISYGFSNLEWAYQEIQRKIIIEKLLRDKNGKLPDDYKLNVIHGKCELIQVCYDRFTILKTVVYTSDWNYINIQKRADTREKPEQLQQIIDLAELLGKPFDFIRVDLYLVDNKIYFGELTNYPMGGRTPFHPIEYDFKLGSKWTIIPDYWKNKDK